MQTVGMPPAHALTLRVPRLRSLRGVAAEKDNIAQMRMLVALCDLLGFPVILNAGRQAQWGPFARVGDTGDARGWQAPHTIGGKPDPARARQDVVFDRVRKKRPGTISRSLPAGTPGGVRC